MKDFSIGYGWHVRMIGGPGPRKVTKRKKKGETTIEVGDAEWFMRSMNGHRDPQEEANSLRRRICIVGNDTGWYVKRAARKADGSIKEIKHKGVLMICWEYVWEEVKRVAV